METMSARVVSITEAPRTPTPRDRTGQTASTADIRVDGWLVQPMLNALTRNEVSVRLRPQLMDLLVCLASRPGKVVLKDEILAVVWDGRWIAESGLSRCIAELRAALGDDARRPRIIETITKRGYRLIAHVEPVSSGRDVAPAAAVPAAICATATNGLEGVVPTRSFWQRLECMTRVFATRFRS